MAKNADVSNGAFCRLQLVRLASNSNTRTSYALTTSATAVVGPATAIPVLAVPKALEAGDKVTFGANSYVVTANVDVSAGPFSIPAIVPTGKTIAASSTGSYFAMRSLSADKVSIKSQGKDVEITGFGDGLFGEYVKVMIDGSISVSGTFSKADLGYTECLIPLAVASPDQCYFVFSDDNGNGYTYEGRAIISDFTYDLSFRDVGKYSGTLKVNGNMIVRDNLGNIVI
jgi:hypothetical protein